jgi:hypothetical protein
MAAIIYALIDVRPHFLRATGAIRLIKVLELSLFPALRTAPRFLHVESALKQIAKVLGLASLPHILVLVGS